MNNPHPNVEPADLPQRPFSLFPGGFQGEQLKPTVILLSSLVLSLVWWHFGRFPFYDAHLAGRWDMVDDRTMRAVYTFVNCFVLLGVIPAMIVKLVFGENLADYGVQWGIRWRTARSFLMFAPVFVVAGYLGAHSPNVTDVYPIDRGAGDSAGRFVLHVATYVFLYMGFEFHYRGFVQFGLRESLGEVNAVLVQVATSVLIHLGKPAGETFGSLLCGILWGIIAFRTRSILSGMLQHFLLGVTLDFFVCFG